MLTGDCAEALGPVYTHVLTSDLVTTQTVDGENASEMPQDKAWLLRNMMPSYVSWNKMINAVAD